MNTPKYLLALAGTVALSACNPDAGPQAQDDTPPSPDASATPDPEPTQTVSILRPEVEQAGAIEKPPLEPLRVTIGFPDGGSELDADAVASLEGVIASAQIATGLPIVLGSHSDSAGSDMANERSSQARGVAVARWLINQGIDAERITVIAFGEQNPIAPNAKPDGAPDEAGRAVNRRVEILIDTDAAKDSEASEEAGDATAAVERVRKGRSDE